MNEAQRKALDSLQKQYDQKRTLTSQPEVSPEAHADVIKLSEATGVPADVVSRNRDAVKKTFESVPPAMSPTVQKMQLDPDMAPVIKDDLYNLDWFDRQIGGITQSWKVGRQNVEMSKIGNEMMWGDPDDVMLSRLKEIQADQQNIKDYDFSYVGGIPSATAENLPIWAQIVSGSAEEVAVGGALGFVGTMGNPAGAVAGAGMGFKVGSATEAFKLESGLAYIEYMDMGEDMDHDTARGAAVAVGMINAGLEAASLNYILRSLPGAEMLTQTFTREGLKKAMKIPTIRDALSKFGRTVAGGMATEGVTEGLQELVTTVGGIAAAEYNGGEFDLPTAGEVLARVSHAAVKGSQGGAGFSLATGSANLAIDAHNVKRANQRAAMFQEMGAAAKDSKLRERLPEKFQKFIQEAQNAYGSVADIYLPRDIVDTLFQQGFDEVMPETMRRFEEADLTGQVAVPIDEFATWIAPSDMYNEILPEMKLSPDELSLREAQEKQAELDEYRDMASRMDESSLAEDPVYQDMMTQLQEAGQSPVVAEQQAKLWSAFFNTQAQRTQQDAFELYKSFNASVRRTDLRGDPRGGVSRLDNLLDRLRAGKIPEQGDIYGDTYGQALAKAGGIRDSGGELKARDFDRRVADRGGETYFAGRKLSREDGMSLADAITFGIENGYLPGSAWETMNDMDVVDLLDREINGEPVYRDVADHEALKLREDLEYLQGELDRMGIDLNEMSNQEVKDLIDGGGVFFQRDDRNDLGFYSKVARIVRDLKLPEWKDGGLADGNVIWKKLNKEGARKEELEWLGIENWLAAGRSRMEMSLKLFDKTPAKLDSKEMKKLNKSMTKFSREEVLNFVEKNGVQVEEVVAEEDYSGYDSDEGPRWSDPEVWDDSELWAHRIDDLMYEYDRADHDWFELEDWANKNSDEYYAEIGNLLDDKYFPEFESAYESEDFDAMESAASESGVDFWEVVRQLARDDAEDAANEQAKAEYYDNPELIYTLENADEDVYIVGNDDTGFSLRRGGLEYWHRVNDEVHYSLGEAQIQAADFIYSEGLLDDSNRDSEARWGDHITSEVGDLDNATNYREIKLTLPQIEEDYYNTTHFPDRNIVAFMRVTDRDMERGPGDEGGAGRYKTAFFIDEMQSDWHQQGRQKGYKKGLSFAEFQELDGLENNFLVEYRDEVVERFSEAARREDWPKSVIGDGFEVLGMDMSFGQLDNVLAELARNSFKHEYQGATGNVYDTVLHIAEAIEKFDKDWLYGLRDRLNELDEVRRDLHAERSGVPNAPFKGDNWIALAVKRALVLAAEEGAEVFAWADSNVVVDRWGSASQELYENTYDKKMPGIVATEMRKLGFELKPVHKTLEGEAYPQRNDYPFVDGTYDPYFDEDENHWILIDPNGEPLRDYGGSLRTMVSEEEAVEAAEFYHEESLREWEQFHNETPQGYWSIPITKELSDQILTEGFTLFQKERIDGVTEEGADAMSEVYSGMDNAKGYIQFNDTRDWYRITLTEKADMSTFLHESGHFFLEALQRMAEDGPDSMKRDLAIIRDWLGATGELTTEQHEKFARGFEAYLREGRTPSMKLASAFERFRSWLKLVYRSMMKLDVELTDDVRGVMDRLLATDMEIQEAKAETGFMPLIQGVDTELMTPEEYKAYTRLHERATREAEDALEKQLLSEVSQEAKARLREEKKIVTAQVKAEVEAMPEQRAYKELKDGPVKLSRAALRAMYVDVPPALNFVSAKEGGVHPDDVAGEYGYATGDQLVQALVSRPKKQDLIDKMVDERVKPVDSLSDGTATEKALQAIHNDPAALFLHAELKALGKRIGQESSLGVVKQAARERISRLRVMDLKPGDYRVAEKRASREAVEALRKKNYPAAHDAKRRQLLNHYLYMEATKAKAEASGIYQYLKQFDKRSVRERLGKTDYLDAIDALLEGVELKQKTNRTIARRKSLAEFVESAYAREEAVVIPESLINESQLRNYKQMTMEDFRALKDAVQNIDHLSRLKDKLRKKWDEVDYQATMAKLVETVYANNEKRPESERQNPNLWDKFKGLARTAHAQLTKVEFITRWIDGEVAGMAHELIFQPFVDAQAAKYDRLKEMNTKLQEIFSSRTKDQVARHKSTYYFMGKKMKGEDVLAVALNTGNEGNLMKLTDGYGWNPGQMQEELDRFMTREDWDLVQSIWDTVDSLWPDIEAVHKRATGLSPARVEARPVVTQYGTYRGGYYPVVYDPRQTTKKSLDQRRNQEAKAAKGMFENNFMRPDVDRGFTQSRTGYSAPILLSLDVLPAHINEVVHFITHYEAVTQVLKIVEDKDFRIAIEETMGPEMAGQFKPWLQAIANDSNVHQDVTLKDRVFTHLRGGMTVVAMGFKLSTATMQAFGLFTTLDEIGWKGTYRGMKNMLLHPKQSWDFVNESSGEMRHILTTFDRDIRKTVDEMFGKQNVWDAPKQYAFHMMGYIQKTVNMITWQGAYENAIEAGESHERAVNIADASVRQSQSAGGVKDLAQIQRGTPTHQIFVMFYTYFSVLYNRLTDTGKDIKELKPEVVARLSYLILMPVFFETLLRGKEPEDEDEWLEWFAVQSALYTLTTIPFARDIASGAMGEYGYSITPVEKFGQAVSRAYKGAMDDDEMTEAEFRAAFDALGVAFKLPTGQAWSFYEYMRDIDDVEDPIRELIVGVDKD